MRYKLIVKSNPSSPAQEEEFNDWYTHVHLGQILDLPGFLAAERFVFNQALNGTPEPTLRYLVIYDVETDDLPASITAMRERLGTPRLTVSSAIDNKSAQMEIYAALADGPTFAKRS